MSNSAEIGWKSFLRICKIVFVIQTCNFIFDSIRMLDRTVDLEFVYCANSSINNAYKDIFVIILIVKLVKLQHK